MMNRENIEEKWDEISNKLKNRFPKLTEPDLVYVKGKEEDLLNRIQLRIGKTREAVISLIGTL